MASLKMHDRDMFRVDLVKGEVEKRPTVGDSSKFVAFLSDKTPGRENREKRECKTHGWFITEEKAYSWMVLRRASELEKIRAIERQCSKQLGSARLAYRKKFGKIHPA